MLDLGLLYMKGLMTAVRLGRHFTRKRRAPRVFGFGRARPGRVDEVLKRLVGMTSYTFPSGSFYLHKVALGPSPDCRKCWR